MRLLLLLLLLTSAFAQTKPNIIVIMTDDMGWADLGSYGAKDIRTPNIDSLARDGVKFTNFYSNGVLCTPTRAGFISGRYQQRYGIEEPLHSDGTHNSWQGLPVKGHSLPKLLADVGYSTALIGKWHVGYKPEYSPLAHGFQYFFGLKSGYHDFYRHTEGLGKPDLWENDKRVEVPGYTTDLITERTVRFIADNATKPFFIDVAYNAPHWPYQPPDKPSVAPNNSRHVLPYDANTSTRADYVAMVERVDKGVGDILRALREKGLHKNTIVIFTNDNGGEWLASNGPLFNRKMTVWEGGIRVPALIRWPGKLPAGKVTSQVGITMDLTASLLTAAGAKVPSDSRLEGIDLFPILQGKAQPTTRTLFWRSHLGRSQKAVRRGDHKLVIDGAHALLFDLRTDIGERNDLAKHRPELARELFQLLQAWEKDVDAEYKAHGPHPPATKLPTQKE